MNDVKGNLARLSFWDKISDKEREELASAATIRHFKKGSMIHSCTGSCLGMFMILSGSVRTFMLSEEGREITLFRQHEGDCCILAASCVIREITFDTTVMAETDCELLIISAGTLSRMKEQNIYVRCFVYELATERFSAVMWSMQQILFKGYDRRLASFLVEEYDRTGKAEIRMTHEQIAQQTSSVREVAARMIKRFASDGLVESRRGSVKLLDVASLRDLAE